MNDTLKTARTVWVMRHALREDMHPVRWCDSIKHMVDPDLQPLGLEMSRRVAARLAPEPITHVMSSPFLRTLRTADVVVATTGHPILVENGFHEMLDPKWFPDGVPVLPDLAARAREFPRIDLTYRSLGGPTGMEPPDTPNFGVRVRAAIEAVLAAVPGNILIISHYAVCNCINHFMTGSYVNGFIELTSISKYVQVDGHWTAECTADASHLNGIQG